MRACVCAGMRLCACASACVYVCACCDAAGAVVVIVSYCVTVLMPVLITHKNWDGMCMRVCVHVCVRAAVLSLSLWLIHWGKRGPDFSKRKYQNAWKQLCCIWVKLESCWFFIGVFTFVGGRGGGFQNFSLVLVLLCTCHAGQKRTEEFHSDAEKCDSCMPGTKTI